MNIKKSVLAILLCAALLVGGAGVILLGGLGIADTVIISKDDYKELTDIRASYKKLETLRKFVSEAYYQEVDQNVLIEGAYSGLVSGLGDQYSQYMNAETYKTYMESMLGEYSGIGISFSNNGKEIEIIQVFRRTPAAAAGLEPGDIVLEVDGVPYSGDEYDIAAAKIKGEAGTKVTITYRHDNLVQEVTIVRDNILVETVSHKMLADDIGYIYIESFESATATDFKAALSDIMSKGAKKFVLDLRNNGGGLVDISVEIADILMDAGTVVYTEDQNGAKEYYTSAKGRTELEYVVLVNGGTASASEILTAGIQDNKEAFVVGTQTYGKGIIQSINPLSDGSAIKLTIRQYFSASGKKIHGVGITPDYVVELPEDAEGDVQLNKAIELLTQDKI